MSTLGNASHSPGPNSTAVAITGTTTDTAGHQISVNLQAQMTVNALLMDIRLFDGATEVDFTMPLGLIVDLRRTGEAYPDFATYNPTATVQNAGNGPIDFTVWLGPAYNSNVPLIPQHTLAVAASETFPDTGSGVVLDLSAAGTITNHVRLPLTSTGHAFMYLSLGDEPGQQALEAGGAQS